MTETPKKEIQNPLKYSQNSKEYSKNEKTRPKALNQETFNLPFELNPNIRYSERDDKLKNFNNQDTIDLDSNQSIHSKNISGASFAGNYNSIIASPNNGTHTKHFLKIHNMNFKYNNDFTSTRSDDDFELGIKIFNI